MGKLFIYPILYQVKADPRSTYVRCLRVVRRSRVGVRRSSVNLTFWLCCYVLVDSSLRQHVNTSRDWQWLGEIPCQIYIPESRSWSFPIVCKITRTGRSLPKFPSPQRFGRILQAEGEISATQVYIRQKDECLLDKFPEVGKNSMTYYEDIGICIEQFGGMCFYCRKHTSFGVRKATRLFHWKVCVQTATLDRRTPTLDRRTHFSLG